jgi:hypothetical protein
MGVKDSYDDDIPSLCIVSSICCRAEGIRLCLFFPAIAVRSSANYSYLPVFDLTSCILTERRPVVEVLIFVVVSWGGWSRGVGPPPPWAFRIRDLRAPLGS